MVPGSGSHVTDVIGAYALGALEDDENKTVEAHLLICEGCREAARDASAATELLGPNEDVTPPPEVWERIRAEVRERGAN